MVGFCSGSSAISGDFIAEDDSGSWSKFELFLLDLISMLMYRYIGTI